ncbi:MAG: tyrosine--tRNA ligase [Candidatus Altiarchaeota archaeon]
MDEELILRNVVEVVTSEELSSLLSGKKNPSVYCGFEVSGPVHVGTLVAATKLKDFMDAGFKVKVLLADVHTRLNRKDVDLDAMIEYWRESFKAFGLKKAEYILGSSFQFNDEYIQDVLEIGLKTTLNRALRSMQEVARDIEHAHVSQVIYPLMQIADIKALSVDVSYGGIEQRKIQMLAREVLPEIGYKKPVCVHTPLISSLKGPDVKMSSSIPDSMISVQDTPEEISAKVKSAYCPTEKAGNPILGVTELVIFPRTGIVEVKRQGKFGGDVSYDSYERLEGDYLSGKLHPQDLKSAVSTALSALLEPVKEILAK